MIQGLGLKHQPLLHHKNEGDADKNSGSNVGDWVDGIEPAPVAAEKIDPQDVGYVALENREGHFIRPLREVRVGESPSRPWGIPIPSGPPHLEDDLAGQKDTVPESKSAQASGNINSSPTKLPMNHKASWNPAKNSPRVIFNGPVFIGYPPEQAAVFLKQSGMSK